MNKTSAKHLVKQTLEHSFDKGRFAYLVKNILNHVDEDSFTYQGNLIFDDFDDSIAKVERTSKYTDPQDRLLDILVVHLKKETSLERARTMQRNFVAKYLNGSRGGVLKDAALVAFVAPNGEDWRFSFVKMEYRFDEKGKVKEEFTPARRYSFLVGKNEHSHTAQSNLLPLLQDDEAKPTLAYIEQAFSVERVTKEFFEKYRELYLHLKEALDEIVEKDPKIEADFEGKSVDTVDFAKKLMGQIVFLYFLQKKGWFGVARGKEWGEGNKQFLRHLFPREREEGKNYFNRFLEPLFYEALRLERPKDYYDQFECRIPFLNGGLFDPINDYDWQDTDIEIPNEIFSNNELTKEGDTGSGILDVFDRYNFTVKEDEPLEKEVAVDPEMLGKVFENLLDIKDRKSKGTYYTPREIVHYMCQESLINALHTNLDGIIPINDLEALIKHGDAFVEHEETRIEKIANRKAKNADYKGSYKRRRLPASIEEYAELIDDELASMRVCDPAVGSGAFVVGMMNEIIRARRTLAPYTDGNKEDASYHFKRHAIQHCLYGVDIDPGAVEIAKLRLWLSLVVDEEDRGKIKPLPNLDYKIIQGNSLLSVEKDLFNQELFNQIEKLKPLYFNETNAGEKQKYKNQIDELISQITKGHKEFDFEVYFSEVFHNEKKGFDVVIGNPPYVNVENLSAEMRSYLFSNYQACEKRTDIYIAFLEKSLSLLNGNGSMCFIIPAAFTKQQYATTMRKIFVANHTLQELVDASSYRIFENAVVYNVVLRIAKGRKNVPTRIRLYHNNSDFDSRSGMEFLVDQSFFDLLKDCRFDTNPSISDAVKIKEKIWRNAIRLDRICLIAYGARLNHRSAKIGKSHYISSSPVAGSKKFCEGRNIGRYSFSQDGWLDYAPDEHYNPMFPELFESEKLMFINIVKDRLRFAYDDEGFYNSHTVINCVRLDLLSGTPHTSAVRAIRNADISIARRFDCKFLLAILNSQLTNWYFLNFLSESLHFYPNDAKELPIPRVHAAEQHPFIRLVDSILQTKYIDQSAATTEQEAEINQLVYALYGLTAGEIELVEGER